uniref:Translocation protein SEC62 n=1 Tax=Acrobeloides nanus TaxID=290746 RepID=A0A914DMZ3_9BILA
MADRRKGGKKNKNEVVSDKLSKEDEAVAKFVRFNCPTKTTMFEGNEVHYFTAAKAVETLLESKKYGANAKNPRFLKKEDANIFMEDLLQRGYFFRAKKLVLKKKEDKKKDKEDKVDSKKSPKALKKSKTEARDSETAGESAAEGKKDQKDSEEDSKKKKKVKLIAHDSQVFIDSNDVYVWIFDPTPLYKKVIGLLMVLGTIAGCLFPLWPDWLRLGVYYVSVVGICLFGLLLGVALVRTILFGIIWAATMGRHKLWILPNLTEDCGFFESFQPWYTYEYCSGDEKKDEKKPKKKDKNSDDEQEEENEQKDENSQSKEQLEEPANKIEQENDDESKNSDESENGSSNELSDEEISQEELDLEASETNDTSPQSEQARKRRRPRREDGFVVVK